MFWPALMVLVVAVVFTVAVGMAAYLGHIHEHTPPLHAAAGSPRSEGGGRHRLGGGLSVAGLRARENAGGMRMYPGGGGGRS